NFPISALRAPADLVTATILIKKAAAEANRSLGRLEPAIAKSPEAWSSRWGGLVCSRCVCRSQVFTDRSQAIHPTDRSKLTCPLPPITLPLPPNPPNRAG